MIQHGSSICVAHAQTMVRLVHESPNVGDSSALPWWYRIFYLHMAGTVLLAARLAEDLFTAEVSHSWDLVIEMLKSHEHLSPFIPQILSSFQTLAGEIPQKSPDYSLPLDTASQVYFQDVFQSMPFDVDSFFFGDDYTH